MKKIILSMILLASVKSMALSIAGTAIGAAAVTVGGVVGGVTAGIVGVSASISCGDGCSESVQAAKDDAAQVALGNEPSEIFKSAAANLRAENPTLNMTDHEAALIMLGITSK